MKTWLTDSELGNLVMSDHEVTHRRTKQKLDLGTQFEVRKSAYRISGKRTKYNNGSNINFTRVRNTTYPRAYGMVNGRLAATNQRDFQNSQTVLSLREWYLQWQHGVMQLTCFLRAASYTHIVAKLAKPGQYYLKSTKPDKSRPVSW